MNRMHEYDKKLRKLCKEDVGNLTFLLNTSEYESNKCSPVVMSLMFLTNVPLLFEGGRRALLQ